MGWFGRKREVVDLGARYKRQQEQLKNMQKEMTAVKQPETFASAAENSFSFLGSMAGVGSSNPSPTSSVSSNDYLDVSSDVEEKRRRLTKRIMDMTEKIEELSNQIYHLQQRVEVLEKKSGVSGGY